MPSVTFVGKHSKDKALSIYLTKRVFVDEGEGLEPITGIVRLDPSVAPTLSSDQAVFCTLSCYFIYECYDFDVEIIDFTVFERSIQLYPKSEVVPQLKNTKLQLPDEFHFPFEFRLPVGLPPSITLNPGFVYLGRPLGVSYEVAGSIGSLTSGSQSSQRSRVPLRFRKASYFPMLKDVKPTEVGEKVYLGGSRPLILTVSLDHEIYYVGQPILVTVDIKNQSSHDVHKIRISAKQVVTARIHSGDKEQYKCQVALLESTRGCPIRKHTSFNHTFSISPQIMNQETYHVAQVGRLNLSEEPQLAPSTRSEESPKDRKGLQVSYYVNVHCEVSLAKDLIVKIPFIVSGSERKEEEKPAKPAVQKPVEILTPEVELLVNKLVEQGFSRSQASDALKKFNNNFEKSFDWLKENKQELLKQEQQEREKEASLPNDLLISFEDAEINQDDNIPAPYDPFSDMAAIKSSRGTGGPIPIAVDISKAYEAISAARMDFITVQAAAAQGILAPLPFQENEIGHLMNSILSCGAKLQEFLSDLGNPNDPTNSYTSAYATASHVKILANIVKSVASHSSNGQMQQNILSVMHDLLERFAFMFQTSREILSAAPNAELRRKLMTVSDLISQGFNALRLALPGLKEIDLAVATINTALSELSYDLPTGVDADRLQQALDNLNSTASQLSQVFQKLGAASTGPTDELASVAQQYRLLLPLILSHGKIILAGMVNEQAKIAFLKLLQDAGASNVQLLLASKEINASPRDQVLKNKLESRAREVIESMKKLLVASNALQNQLRSAPTASSSGGTLSKASKTPAPSATPSAAPAPASSSGGTLSKSAVNPMLEQMKPSMKRRDSFDEFIVHRAGSKATTVSPEPELQDETTAQLAVAFKEIDTAQKSILAARARPRMTVDGSKPAAGSSSILDAVFGVVQISNRFVTMASERYKEVSIIGKSFSQNVGPSQEAKAKLSSSVKNFSSAISNLVARSSAVASGTEDFTQLIVSSSTSSAAAATLLEACRLLSSVNSPTQQLLESSAKDVIQQLSLFITTAMNISVPSQPQQTGVEQQMRVLQLEQNLERERSNHLLNSPRRPSRTAYDSD